MPVDGLENWDHHWHAERQQLLTTPTMKRNRTEPHSVGLHPIRPGNATATANCSSLQFIKKLTGAILMSLPFDSWDIPKISPYGCVFVRGPRWKIGLKDGRTSRAHMLGSSCDMSTSFMGLVRTNESRKNTTQKHVQHWRPYDQRYSTEQHATSSSA